MKLVPPPKKAIFTGMGDDFSGIEEEIGIRLPPDYIEYILHYGDCVWYDHISILIRLRIG